jgi:hypothetical protein
MAALLRACLVTGYGDLGITSLVVAGEVATATIDGGNPLTIGQVIAISGATPATLNAEWKITAADATTVTFNTPGIADVTATGTISATLPGAGWEEPYEEVNNYACFRALVGDRKFYQVNDNVDADITKMTMFDSMSGAESGIGSNGDQSLGKYYSGASTDWHVFADQKTCILALCGSNYGRGIELFGEFYSYLKGDPKKSLLSGHTNTSSYFLRSDSPFSNPRDFSIISDRNFALSSGLATSTPGNFGLFMPLLDNPYLYMPIPRLRPYDGTFSYIVHPYRFFYSGEDQVRGALRGIFIPEAHLPKTDGEIFSFNSRNYIALNLNSGYSNSEFQVFVDIGEGWEESV